MFKKLRNKLILMNMLTFSFIILATFLLIYWTMYNSIQDENYRDLTETIFVTEPIVQENSNDGKMFAPKEEFTASDSTKIETFPHRFTITVDENGVIGETIATNTNLKVNYDFAVNYALNNQDKTTVQLSGRTFLYEVKYGEANVFIKEGDNAFSGGKVLGNRQISFLDITASQNSLRMLRVTLILICVLMLVVIFFVSLFFAKRSIQPLKEAWRKQRQFVADASHELKTPLAIIMSNYDVLIANQDETIRSQKDWLDYMGIGMDRMTKLINDLLLLANIEKDQPITKECFHINDSISDIINAMTSLADGKEIKLIFKPQAMITLVSNKDMMEQVITILLDNAIKYSYCNTIISLNTSYNRKKQVVISVENHGEGIAADALERIFDRFYQADAARTAGTEGYGLGLPIAQSILKQLRGSILCESDSSGTTRFFITLSG